ncbi:M3 family oligoendopeptidase [Armatimonas sp.]|uniref:M3 family oligoendopeptidase n=1 Tax=Armatimonas sp. TaxID=1872638 RepID=UPI002869ECF5|nr:M3 family oligoendopeptidase [Armatimonas sp.]
MSKYDVLLPRWDLSPLFTELDTPGFTAAFADVLTQTKTLETLFNEKNIIARPSGPLTDEDIAAYEAITKAFNALYSDLRRVRAYLSLRIATDSRDAAAQAKLSELRGALIPLSSLGTRFTAFMGSLDSEALIAKSEVAAAHAYGVREAKVYAEHQLPLEQEELVAHLSLSGSSAWARLHSDLTSQLTVDFNGESTPMSVIRTLATDESAETRKSAYEAELKAWKGVALPLAFAMNGIKHETRLLAERRGWSDVLELCCNNNSITRATLDAMRAAAEKSFPDFRRYLKAKARKVSNAEALPWWDLLAPLSVEGSEASDWSWSAAERFIGENFDAYSQKMGDFARKTFAESWIDAEPRPGKRDGAFCSSVGPGESRIMQNYRPSFDGVSTLAHELGHAYHNLCLKDRTILQSSTPMTLAETASIFCETIVKHAALKSAEPAERLAILEASLQNSCQVVVDIDSRFRFEQAVIEKRKERDLSEGELCELMLTAQRETYGDGLDSDALHPYMWAVKGHYYGSAFYNFPYMFGFLFGLGLYAQYEQDPESFRAAYDDLLSQTGMANATELAQRFGLDIESEAFWSASLDVVRAEIDQFVSLLEDKG